VWLVQVTGAGAAGRRRPSLFRRGGRYAGDGEYGAAKWAFAISGIGLFIASMTFVNAYVAQGAIASGRSSAFGNTMRRLGLSLVVASLLLFLAGIALEVLAI